MLLQGLPDAERAAIVAYMDRLKAKTSTVPYDPAMRRDLLHLASLERVDREDEVEKLPATACVFCVDPEGTPLRRGDKVYAEIPDGYPADLAPTWPTTSGRPGTP